MHQKTLDQVSKTTIQLLLEEPFYGHFLTGVLKSASNRINSLGSRITNEFLFQIDINPTYWNSIQENTNLSIGALKHEVLHIALGHPIRFKEFEHSKIFHIAADLVVNQYLSPEQLTEQAIVLANFPDFNLLPEQSLDYYYDKLLQAWTNYRAEVLNHSASIEKLESILLKENAQIEQHKAWESLTSAMSAASIRLIDRTRKLNLRNAMDRTGWKSIGQLPGVLVLHLENLNLQKAKRNWRRILRQFTASKGGSQLKHTIHRPSKRYGTSPGIKLNRKKQILVVLDTSASIQRERFEAFFSEIHQIWKQGHAIMLLEADAEVQNNYWYKGQLPKQIKGRGGTNFDPALSWANQHFSADGLLYFTDGYGPSPSIKSRKPLLWVIAQAKEGQFSNLPGPKISIE